MRDLADFGGQLGPRHAAVERQARAGQVEGISRPERDPGAVGQAAAAMRHVRREFLEQAPLPLVLRGVLVGRSEVRHQRFDLQAADQRIADFSRRQAEAIDAGVDHQVARPATAIEPQPRLVQAVDHRTHAGAASVFDVVRTSRAVQHDDLARRRVLRACRRPRSSARRRRSRQPASRSTGTALATPMPYASAFTAAPALARARHPVERAPVAGQRLARRAAGAACAEVVRSFGLFEISGRSAL